MKTTITKEMANTCIKSGVMKAVLENVDYRIIDTFQNAVLVQGGEPYSHLKEILFLINDEVVWFSRINENTDNVWEKLKDNLGVLNLQFIKVSAFIVTRDFYILDIPNGIMLKNGRMGAHGKISKEGIGSVVDMPHSFGHLHLVVEKDALVWKDKLYGLLTFQTAEEGKEEIISLYATESEVVSGDFADDLMENKKEYFSSTIPDEVVNEAIESFREWDACEA